MTSARLSRTREAFQPAPPTPAEGLGVGARQGWGIWGRGGGVVAASALGDAGSCGRAQAGLPGSSPVGRCPCPGTAEPDGEAGTGSLSPDPCPCPSGVFLRRPWQEGAYMVFHPPCLRDKVSCPRQQAVSPVKEASPVPRLFSWGKKEK